MRSTRPRIVANALQHEAAQDRYDTHALLALDGKTQSFSITYLMHVDRLPKLLHEPLPTNLDEGDRFVQYLQQLP